jgi:hypothetical protein
MRVLRTFATIASVLGLLSACSVVQGHKAATASADREVIADDSCKVGIPKIPDGSRGLFYTEIQKDLVKGGDRVAQGLGFMTKAKLSKIDPWAALKYRGKLLAGVALEPLGSPIEINGPGGHLRERASYLPDQIVHFEHEEQLRRRRGACAG